MTGKCLICHGTTKHERSYRLRPYVVHVCRCGICGATQKEMLAVSGDTLITSPGTKPSALWRQLRRGA